MTLDMINKWKYLFLLVFVALALFFLSHIDSQNSNSVLNILKSRYPQGYTTRTIKSDNYFIGFAEEKQDYSEPDEPICKSLPIVYVAGGSTVKDLYEIDFAREYTECVVNDRFEQFNDSKGNILYITEWYRVTPSPGGARGLIVWRVENESLFPVTGYPHEIETTDTKSLSARDLLNDKEYRFGTTGWGYFTDYENQNTSLTLRFGKYIWNFDAGESRNSPHIWKLQRFRYDQGEFVIDESCPLALTQSS